MNALFFRVTFETITDQPQGRKQKFSVSNLLSCSPIFVFSKHFLCARPLGQNDEYCINGN